MNIRGINSLIRSFAALSMMLLLSLTGCNNPQEGAKEKHVIPEEIKALPEGTTLGLRAPEIKLPDVNGEIKRLSELQGKLVLLDFWAAWCTPCRQENVHLVEVYNNYRDEEFTKGSGFEIFQVSLDRDEKAWKEAIMKDKLIWEYQLGDMEGAGTEPAREYNIQMIPASFLLDENGVVIARNLRGEMLDAKLNELLVK